MTYIRTKIASVLYWLAGRIDPTPPTDIGGGVGEE